MPCLTLKKYQIIFTEHIMLESILNSAISQSSLTSTPLKYFYFHSHCLTHSQLLSTSSFPLEHKCTFCLVLPLNHPELINSLAPIPTATLVLMHMPHLNWHACPQHQSTYNQELTRYG
jgi:hypothetical protein